MSVRNSFIICLYLIILNSINLAMNVANGTAISELYNAEIEVYTKHINDTDRNNLVKMEFDKILRKITGKSTSLTLEEAEQYLIKYEYLKNYPSENKLTLKLYFDKGLINKTLQANRYVILSENRPSTLIWLQVEDTLLFEYVQQFLNKIAQIGADYGLNVIYPILDLPEVKLLNQNLEHHQFVTSIKEFSKKYAADEIIVADYHMHEEGFIINWKSVTNIWEFKNQLVYINGLNNNHNTHDRVENTGFDIQANTFIENLFQHFLNLQIHNTKKIAKQIISLKINNVKNLEDYVKIEKYLQGLPIISNLTAAKFDAEEVEFEVVATGGKAAIKKALANNQMLCYKKTNIANNDAKHTGNINSFVSNSENFDNNNQNIYTNNDNINNNLEINSNIASEQSPESSSLLYTFQYFS